MRHNAPDAGVVPHHKIPLASTDSFVREDLRCLAPLKEREWHREWLEADPEASQHGRR